MVQPILTAHCARCHDGEGDARPRLAETPEETFTEAYFALKPYVRWYEWGGESISVITTRPGEMPSDLSPLVSILDDANHVPAVALADAERRALYLWLDGNAAFYGAYSQAEQLAQFRGQNIPPPVLQ